jgi:CheY-like chemotaxis protein
MNTSFQLNFENQRVSCAEKDRFSIIQSLDIIQRICNIECEATGKILNVLKQPHVPDYAIGNSQRLQSILISIVHFSIQQASRGGKIWLTLSLGESQPADPDSFILYCFVKHTGPSYSDDYFAFLNGIIVDADTRNEETEYILRSCVNDIRLMNGSFRVDTKNRQGACFDISLTLKRAHVLVISSPPRAVEPAVQAQPQRQHCVLVVDDNDINRRMQTKLLERTGCRCETAENGLIAIKKCADTKYDLILMDIQMPVMDGYEAVREIRQKAGPNQSTMIYALSANHFEEANDKSLQSGMDGFICKPLQKETVKSIVDKLHKLT